MLKDGVQENPIPGDLSELERLRKVNEEITQSLRELTHFVDKTSDLLKCSSLQEALDISDALIMECVDFTYFKLCLRTDEHDVPREVRKLCPDDFTVDDELLQWAMKHHQPTLIPLESPEMQAENIRSLILVPFGVGQNDIGYLALWVDFDETRLTQFTLTLLRIYAQQFTATIQNLFLQDNILKARQLLLDVADSVPYAIFTVDSRGRITTINENTEFLFQVRRDGAVGKHYNEIFHPRLADAFRNFINSSSSGRELGEQELECSLDDKTTLNIGVTVAPVRQSAGHHAGFVLLCRDLRLTREVVKLRELGAMKDDFISLVSHELRTPLAAIMAYSESLLMENIVEDEKERREYLEIIHSEGERLSRLINDILDLSKMESGKMTYHFEESQIDSVVYTTMMNFDVAAKQKQLELISDVEENIPPTRFDHDRIVQVLMNLIGNSVKFTEAGGKIHVKAKHIAPDKTHNGFIEVSVEDTGCGIPPEQFACIFNKFEQVENVRHHSGGTGLGMPICRQIVEDGHGGKIWFDSKVGVGTTFFFRLPL